MKTQCAQIKGFGKARRKLASGGPLKGGQKKLDVDGDGKITGNDFALLKKNKKKKTVAKGKSPMQQMVRKA